MACKLTEPYSTWLSQNRVSRFHLVGGLEDSPTTRKFCLSPSHHFTTLPEKQYFCNFHAVFGDFGRTLRPIKGLLAGKAGIISVVTNCSNPSYNQSNITCPFYYKKTGSWKDEFGLEMISSTFRLSKWYLQFSVYRNGIVNFPFIEMVSSTFCLSKWYRQLSVYRNGIVNFPFILSYFKFI